MLNIILVLLSRFNLYRHFIHHVLEGRGVLSADPAIVNHKGYQNYDNNEALEALWYLCRIPPLIVELHAKSKEPFNRCF
jgi:hypothetical protein